VQVIENRIEEMKILLDQLQKVVTGPSVIDVDIYTELAFALEREVRIKRHQSFPKGYFHDPMWDILIDLDHSRRKGVKCSITDLGVETDIPLATLLRYVARLEADGLVIRLPDPADKRRTFLDLTIAGRATIREVFEGAGKSLGTRLKRLPVPAPLSIVTDGLVSTPQSMAA
jgi:MarR family transcriptional regulator, temperature-dependent positive regulator of motility